MIPIFLLREIYHVLYYYLKDFLDINSKMNDKIIEILPLHQNNRKKNIMSNIFKNHKMNESIVDLGEYFGSSYGFYFAWAYHYTKWVSFIALFSLLGLLIDEKLITHKNTNFWNIFYSSAVMIWSTLSIEYWRRKESEYAYKWNVVDLDDIEELQKPRDEFKGLYFRTNNVTKQKEWYYPNWRRYIKYIFTYSITFLMSLLTFCSIIYI